MDVQTLKTLAGSNLVNVDDSGNMTVAGTLTAAGATATGSQTVTGNVTVSGVMTATILALPSAAPQTVNMADAALELVYGITAGAGQLAVTSSRLNVDAQSGGASEDLTIDTTAAGLILAISNVGGEGIVVKSNGGSTLATIAAGGTALVVLGMVILGS